MSDSIRDINGMVFASLFDDDMNDGTEAYAIQSPRSAALAFADKERIEKFVKDNPDLYKLVKKSGDTLTVDSLEDGIRLNIVPLKIERVKNRDLSGIISAIDAKDEDASVVEIKATPLKECLEIVEMLFNRQHDEARELIEELTYELINEKLEIAECHVEGFDPLELFEARYRIKVNAKGKRRRKLICRKGYKVGNGGRTCVRITAAEKVRRKRGMRKALRTKKGKGSSLLKRSLARRKRAMKRRSSMGI